MSDTQRSQDDPHAGERSDSDPPAAESREEAHAQDGESAQTEEGEQNLPDEPSEQDAPGGDEEGDDEEQDEEGDDEEQDEEGDDEEQDEEGDDEEQDEEEQEPVSESQLRPGNPLRIARGSAVLLAGSLVAFVVMALRGQYRWGVPFAALFVLVATFGALDLIGSFDDPEERITVRTNLRKLGPPLGLFAAGLAGLAGFVTLAVAGALRVAASAILIPTAFLLMVAGLYFTGERLGAWENRGGVAVPLVKRHGFWLITITTLIYLPMLGSHSLTDPWETHYGEVAREILSRNDWISLWWAQDKWFWSKPIFDFWVQALAMATFGVRYRSGQLLSAVIDGRTPWPEWAVRLPIFLMTVLAGYLLYKAVAKVFGRRAGFLGGLALVTMPQWFFIAHQTMTDMPFVAMMAAAMALFLLGIHADPEQETGVAEVDLGFAKLRLSAFHLVMGATIACALPQILYLFSRHVDITVQPFGIHLHPDSFSAGSPGNCGLPGNDDCRTIYPMIRGLYPVVQALLWLQALAVLLYMNWGERRISRLYFLGAWFFAALSTMAKGPAGILLPALCAFAYVVVSHRATTDWLMGLLKEFLRMEIVSGLLIVLAVALPWFVAMYARHGQPFTDRLLFHDMYKRAFTHVHDTNEGDDVSFRFYVWQLGYATFPWTGLVPAGLVWWLRRGEEGDRKSDTSVFLLMWFFFAFALFTLMLTKFHHYIFPALPPMAMLAGILFDDMLRRAGGKPSAGTDAAAPGEGQPRETERGALFWKCLHSAGIALGTLLFLWGLHRLLAVSLDTTVSPARTARSVWSAAVVFSRAGAIGAALSLSGVCIAVASAILLGRHAGNAGAERAMEQTDTQDSPDAPFVAQFERLMLGAVGLGGGLLVFLVGRDIAGSRAGIPSQIRLLHLFTYNYKRAWPPSLDFTPTLWAFVIAASILTLLFIVAAWRRHVAIAFLSTAVLFAVWGLNVYFVRTSPHWGQRETALAYYKAIQQIPGPIIAYQMNWKGENFYTGNHLPAFVSSGKKFQDYILEEKKKGVRTFYFFTEHGRTGSLFNELGSPRVFDKLTTPELNNKFLLIRATFE